MLLIPQLYDKVKKRVPVIVRIQSIRLLPSQPSFSSAIMTLSFLFREPRTSFGRYVLHGAGSKLHEDKIARGDKITRGQNCTKGQICTKTFLHEVTNLHDGTKLHKDKFALRVNFARVTSLHGCQISMGGQICTG